MGRESREWARRGRAGKLKMKLLDRRTRRQLNESKASVPREELSSRDKKSGLSSVPLARVSKSVSI